MKLIVGEVIFIPLSYGIFYLIWIEKIVMSLEKDYFDKFLSIFCNKQWRKAMRNKPRQKFSSFMQNKCSHII